MNALARHATLACALLILVGAPAPMAAQTPLPEICLSEPPLDQKPCAERMISFYAYLDQLGAGVTLHTLPPMLVDIFQDF